MGIASSATSHIKRGGESSGNGKPNGIAPTKRTWCTGPNCINCDMKVPPTTASSSAGKGNRHSFAHRGCNP